MTGWTIGLGVVAALSIASGILEATRKRQLQRLYREKVGLDLQQLIALLPTELQGKRYADFRLAPSSDERLGVGLVYHDGSIRSGNPPNVGLEFDAQTGALLQILPDGIGLGLK